VVLLDIYWPAAYRHSHDDESKEAEVIVVGMHPPLDDFVRQLFHEDRDRVDVFVLDAKHNDIPTDITQEIKQYPTMLLFPAVPGVGPGEVGGGGRKPILYTGERTVAAGAWT
jgi:methylmalonyl-CoA mutase cobalamin-binding subunit